MPYPFIITYLRKINNNLPSRVTSHGGSPERQFHINAMSRPKSTFNLILFLPSFLLSSLNCEKGRHTTDNRQTDMFETCERRNP